MIIAVVLIVEAVLHTTVVQSMSQMGGGTFAQYVGDAQHLLFRLLISYAVFSWILIQLSQRRDSARSATEGVAAPVSAGALALHAMLLIPIAGISVLLHSNTNAGLALPLAGAWLICGVFAVAALFAAAAPFPIWVRAVRIHRAALLFAIVPATATTAAVYLSQTLWRSMATVTFRLVSLLLTPILPSLRTDPLAMTVGTPHFRVIIADVCSGLEGMGLMLVFCVAWLWFFRREYYFPRAALLVPVAVALMFLLNSMRIAALVLIGNAGYPNVASIGFHSQAGWIAFNAAAFGVAVFARRSPWLSRPARLEFEARRGSGAGLAVAPAAVESATAPYLIPLLAILAAGMLAHALSAGFDLLYPLRLLAAIVALWAYRRRYREIDWGFSWRGIVVGAAVFAVWVAADRLLSAPHPMPGALNELPSPIRTGWIVCRAVAAMVTVPIAEELAYRGYVMRVRLSGDFDTVELRKVRWPGLAISAVLFGLTHGSMWLPGIIAGGAYGLVAMRTNRLGEAVAAHATTNALLVVAVLEFGEWQYW